MSTLPLVETDDTPVSSRRQRQSWLFPPARPLVDRFGVEFFRNVPESPGVYFMCGIREGVLYVGKARNLRRRLGNYHSANPAQVPRKTLRLLAAVTRIYWDECNDESEAVAREREWLRMLRPKFNTVGTYPPSRQCMGWQRHGAELSIGMGEKTRDWANRYGEFTRVRAPYVSLLRLTWWALHPSASIQDMPSRLLGDDPPAVCRFPASPDTRSALPDDLTQHLDSFLRGATPEFPDWLKNLASASSRFEAQWREHDALCLREFHERQFGPAAGRAKNE